MLRDYYKKQRRIEYLKGRYAVLTNNIKEIERCISETHHTLAISLPSQRYDEERVSTSEAPTNPQEQALLDSERRMQLKMQELKSDRFDCLVERIDVEKGCQEVEKIILGLDDEEKLICEMKFNQKRSLTNIGYEICWDRTTVSRKIKRICEKVAFELGIVI